MCISQKAIKVRDRYTGIESVVPVNCNHCYECVRKRKLDWELRLTVESSVSAHTYFGMLTFNDECYHSDPDSKELRLFIHRLRYNLDKFYPGATLKYFIASELGELKDRLHYHVLYMVSEEFTDTHREFEELCKLSWVKKVPLTDDQITYRKSLWKQYCKTHKDKQSESYREMRRFCRKKYDDISIGFATCQMLKGGTATGSIHYACKYIQKQYNRKYHSKIGYDAWRRYMVETKQLKPSFDGYLAFIPQFMSYPTFPVRGFNVPVPRRWLINTIGKYYASYYAKKLALELSNNPKFVNEDRVASFWHKEPERLAFLSQKDKEVFKSRCEILLFRDMLSREFTFANIEKEWQTITTPKHIRSCPEGQNLTFPTETRLPLKWVN